MRTRRTKDQIRKDNYNKDVDAYNFYVVNLDTKRAETGFEFKSDAVDLLNDYDDKKKYKVVSKRALKSMGIENPNESFKYEGGGYFDGTIPEVSSYMTTYAKGGGFDKQIAFRVENDYIGWLPLGLYDIKLADDYNSQYSFYKFSDALNKLFDYFNNEDGSYLIKNYPESVFYVRKLYAGNKKNNMGDTEIIDKKVFKISAKEILDYKKTYSLKNGGTLIGNQKRIDLNKNGKIDAEDFKLLRTTMNGGWRKDHKYLNSSEDYEVIYARKFKPSRKGYKGKTNFANGGGVDRFSEYSNDALTDMIINLSRYENTESDIQMVKDELEKRKANKKMTTRGGMGIEEEIDLTDDKRLRLRKPVMPERKYSEIDWAEKFNPRAYEFMGKRKMATGGGVEKNIGYKVFNYTDDIYATDEVFMTKTLANKFIKEFRNRFNNQGYYRDNRMNKINIQDIDLLAIPSDFNPYRKYATGGGVSKFKMLSDKVARNYEGKRVKPQYQKEYGKVYSKSEAKEVGDKVAGKVKANQKMATGGETKKGGKGGIMVLAKQIRKEGESWQDALKRAGQQLK
jgi:hypothetical protein